MGTAGARDQFATARALLRLVLAPLVDLPPRAIELGVRCQRCGSQDHGKPQLLGSSTPASFNLTHVDGTVAVAVTTGRAVGIDVTAARDGADPRSEALAATALAPGERAAYRRLPPDERGHAMAVWWSRKEAVLKATGDGLAVDPARVLVSDPSHPPALLGWDLGGGSPVSSAPAYARLHDLRRGTDHVGCVAVIGPRPLIVDERDGGAMLRDASGPCTTP